MHSYGFDGHLYVEIAVGGLARYEKYTFRSTGRVTSNHYQYSYDTLFVMIVDHNNASKIHSLTRSAVLHPRLAPRNRLLNLDNEQSFLEMTGFSRQAFMLLHFSLYW